MILHSIKIEAKAPLGWESEELLFGEHITQLYGPNGCGKTPIIQSIAFALGFPVKYREDILQHCDTAVLIVTMPTGSLRIRRRIATDFDVEVRAENGDQQSFYDEREYSRFVLELLGFTVNALTSTSNDATTPYVATFLPIFYLDQDQGYTSLYKAPKTFIKDQHAEMMRLSLGLPPKNSFDHKKLAIDRKNRLDEVDRLIVRKREHIESLSNELVPRRERAIVDSELDSARAALAKLRDSRNVKSDARSAVDDLLYDRNFKRQQLSREVTELQARISGIDGIRHQIEVEVNTLSLNEEARPEALSRISPVALARIRPD